MGYDNMHRIKSKSQHLTQDNVQFNGTLNAGYDLSYTYGTDTGKKFQLANVKDVNYRTEETPSESENVNNNHAYEYDANGNLVYVNTSRTKKDGVADEKTAERKLKWDEENRLLASDDNGFVTNYWYDANGNLVYVNTSRTKKDGMTDEKAAERKLKWDEENRLLASDDNGFVTNYWYDADGERTVKTSGESDQVYVNSEFAGGRTNTAKFSLYVSPYLVANQGGRYTKHIYIGSQRVVSKIGDFDSYGSDPRRIQYAGSETDGLSVDYKQKYVQQLQVIKDNYATFAVPYNGEDNNDYVDGKGFCCNDGSLEAAQARAMARAMKNNFQEGDTYEKMQFYYHPDHLGSSSYITNLEGEVVQHIEYVPFGEVFIEERNNIWNTPYLFNAKEFDEETGLYYYGARYYEPKVSLWISVDPISIYDPSNSENYIDGEHNDGVYNYKNLNPYVYCYQSPVSLIDPNGKQALPGAIMGMFTEYLSKIGEKMISEDMNFATANSKLGWTDGLDILAAGAFGSVSGIAKFGKFIASPTGRKIMNMVCEVGLSSLEAGFKSIYGDDFSLEAVLVEVGMGDLLGRFLPKKVFKEAADNSKHELNRAKELMQRKSATPKVVKKQTAVLKNAKKGIIINKSLESTSDAINQTVSKTAGSKTQKIKNSSRIHKK